MPTANHVLLQRITLTANAASVTFNSIPQTGYTDLKILISARDDRGGVTTDGIRASFNGSTTGFTYRGLAGSGSAASSYTGTNSIGLTTSATATANTFSNCEVYIPNYTSSNYKSYTVDSVSENNATTVYMELQAGLWSNTAAITSVTFSADTSLGASIIFAGSTFSLYGIADVNTTPKLSPKADGGDIIKTDGTYWYHAFLSSGLFKPQLNLTCDILQVAGAGAGGTSFGGGGGAGGFLEFTGQALLSGTSYPAIVGAGGAWANYASTNGSDSQFASLTKSIGGGIGGSNYSAGVSGGSGGGGSRGGAGASGTSGQGNTGGTGSGSSSAGGGGAGGVGGAGGSNIGGAGGQGKVSAISGGATTGLGVLYSGSYYLAAGGSGIYVGSVVPTPTYGVVSPYVVPPLGSGTGSTEGTNAGSGVIVIRYPV